MAGLAQRIVGEGAAQCTQSLSAQTKSCLFPVDIERLIDRSECQLVSLDTFFRFTKTAILSGQAK